jgi:hypothetical protein
MGMIGAMSLSPSLPTLSPSLPTLSPSLDLNYKELSRRTQCSEDCKL